MRAATMKVTGKVKEPASGIVALGAIACAGSGACYAVGFEGTEVASSALLVKASAAGKILSTVKAIGTGVGAIACPSASTCLLVEHTKTVASVVTVTKGKAGAIKRYSSDLPFDTDACATANLCYAVGPGKAANTAMVVRI